ncbi:MAG: hypothetical protein KDB66_12605 [Solirubrobacterales bacterium]|nr:hypothetical protein [Solirubrobacterales bacterium]
MRENLERLQNQVTGQPHTRNLQRWRELVNEEQLPVLRRVLTGLDRDSIEMREVSPMRGILTPEERDRALSASF